MARWEDNILRGSRAAQPAAAAVAVGTLYSVQNEGGIIERSTGVVWQSYSYAGSPGSGGVPLGSVPFSLLMDPEEGPAGPPGQRGPSGSGATVKVVNTQTGAVATGTTTIPMDDTIPQITEGTEFMTLAITPTSTTNKLKIDVVFNGATATASIWNIVALFQDATANALAAVPRYVTTASGWTPITLTHYMTAGTVSSTTFRVRCGGSSASTVTFNGVAAARLLGGVMASSITITEIVP